MKTLKSDISIQETRETFQLLVNGSGLILQTLPLETSLSFFDPKHPTTLEALFPPSLIEEFWKSTERLSEDSLPLTQSLLALGKEYFIDVQPLQIPGPETYFMLTFTSTQQITESWSESVSKYKTLFESSKTGILIVDWEHRKALEANSRMCELFHSDMEQILAGNMMNFSPENQPDGRNSLDAYKDVVSKAKDYQEFSWQFKRMDGTLFDAEVSISPVELHGIMCGVYIIRDISPIKRQKEELEKYIQSNLQLENFVYIASHDLREPLLTAIGFCKQFKKMYERQLDARGNMLIDTIISRTEYMNILIEELFLYSRVQNDTIHFDWLDPTVLVNRVIDVLGSSYDRDRVHIILDPMPPRIFGNNEQLSRLFQNLLSNALKFSVKKEHAEIRIGATEKKHHWEFWVSDNGMGIPKEHFNKIFALFQRLNNRKEYGGIGLGLAICKQIVENHAGRIWVESTVQEGSTFSFTLKIPS